jgi:prepilin-type N-terminal cleavage/methylation domain-containing protein
VSFVHKLRRRLASEGGYTLVEMVTVMAMMGVVMGGITSLFVSGINAEADQNNRFQAQLNARLSLDKIRREVHCANSVTLSGTVVTLNGVSWYPTMTENPSAWGGTQYTWCTASISSTQYRLFRQSGTTCSSSTGTRYADYIVDKRADGTTVNGAIFAYTPQSAASLAKLTVDIPINRKPTLTAETYELKDDIVLRNSTRT